MDASWQKHPEKYDYTVKRFTEDWTTESSVGVIKSHKVDISKTDGTGTFGTGIIVGGSGERGPQDFYVVRKEGWDAEVSGSA